MRTIKQLRGDKKCVAAVAAMICGTSIQHFVKVMGEGHSEKYGGGYCPEEISDYLSMHHKTFGYMGFDRTDIDFKRKKATCQFDLLRYNAYVVVKSMRFTDVIHAVFWDRDIQMIRDPNPFLPARTKLNTYRVLTWYPVYNQSCRFNKVRKEPGLKKKYEKDFD